MTKEALKLALEGAANYIDALGGDSRKYRQALAQPEQEPVAWAMLHDNGHYIDAIHPDEHARVEGKYIHPLYTTAQRTWVGLTDDEVYRIAFELEGEHWRKIVDAIEAKLKELNT